MREFTIPTAYTVVDKFTAPIRKMFAAHSQFANSLDTGLARGERLFRKMTPALSETSKQMFAFARSAAIAAAVIGGIHFTTDSIIKYEEAVASFRTIVGGSDKDFKPYSDAIIKVAKDTKQSSIDTAAAFEKVAGLNAKFAETATSISQVSTAAIVLSKASRDELGSSAESLVGIMNQFSFAATEANRTINTLAAGTAVGASSIKQTADAFVPFGAVAAGANISLEQSVALIQVLGKYSIFASEAGNKLKGSLLRIQKAGIGYASGQFNINDALNEAKGKLDKLKTAKQKDAYLNKLFGAENISVGRTLLANIGLFEEFTAKVSNTNEATKAAAINSDTLGTVLKELSASWVNVVTGSENTTKALKPVKDILRFVAEHMDTIVAIGTRVLLFFAAWKVLLVATRVALIGYNIVLGITGALSGTASVAIGANAIALGAYKVALFVATAAQWALNVALTANPIGIIIVAIAALGAAVYASIKYWDKWGAAITLAMGPLGQLIALGKLFYDQWGDIKKTFVEEGFLAGIKKIGILIMDSILYPMNQAAMIFAKMTGWQSLLDTTTQIDKYYQRKNMSDEERVSLREQEQAAQQKRIETFRQSGGLIIDINNNTKGQMDTKTSGDSLATIRTNSSWKPSWGLAPGQ